MGIHHVLDPVRDGIFWDFSDAASGSVACKKAADIGIIPMSVNRFSLCFDCPVHGIRRLYQVALWLRQRLQRHLAGAVGACRSVIGFCAAQRRGVRWCGVRGESAFAHVLC